MDFEFPVGTVLAPGAMLLVVSFDPVNNPGTLAEFRTHYSLTASQPNVGSYSGTLPNGSDDTELHRPDAPDITSILVERVRYVDAAPGNHRPHQ